MAVSPSLQDRGSGGAL